MTTPPSQAPSCPRCTYDLSGAAASWTDQCPLSGTCPECGKALSWPDVFNNAVVNERFVEHSRGIFPTLAAAVRTWFWTLGPSLFWKRVAPTMPARPARWVVWLLVILLFPRLLVGLLEGAASLNSINRGAPSLRPIPEVAGALLNGLLAPFASVGMEPMLASYYPVGSAPGGPGILIRTNIVWGLRIPWPRSRWIDSHDMPPAIPVMFVVTLTSAALMMVLWRRYGHPRTQRTRFWRIAIYSLSWLAALNCLDFYSAVATLIHSFATPINRSPAPQVPPLLTLQPASAAWGICRQSTMVYALEHRAGLWVLLPFGIWMLLWWWSAARQGLTRRPPRLALIALSATIVVITASTLLWNYAAVVGYWRW